MLVDITEDGHLGEAAVGGGWVSSGGWLADGLTSFSTMQCSWEISGMARCRYTALVGSSFSLCLILFCRCLVLSYSSLWH